MGEPVLIHKQGSKVVGLDCNPVQPELLLSCGNDHFARIWDMRKLQPGASLNDLAHKRVVNSAYFSPSSGTKILTTSQDNRIRIWDMIVPGRPPTAEALLYGLLQLQKKINRRKDFLHWWNK